MRSLSRRPNQEARKDLRRAHREELLGILQDPGEELEAQFMTAEQLLELLKDCVHPLERLTMEGYYRCDRENAKNLINKIREALRQSSEERKP